MSVLKVRIYGDPVLRQKAAVIDSIDQDVADLATAMGETMYASRGIGLAAPQVGVSRRLVVVDVDWAKKERAEGQPRQSSGQERRLRVFINPEVTWESEEDSAIDEGCLSIPGVEGEVFRPERVKVRYQDLQGARHEEAMDEMLARCIQHEIDHLDGVLFPDRMPFLKRALIAGQLNKLKKTVAIEKE